jgi:hypothetical protein
MSNGQATLTPEETQAFQFAEDLLGMAIDIVGAAVVPVTAEGTRDPKIVALTLLCRTITNFKGAMIMAREELIVESRTLVRLCFENLLWVAALRERGSDFVKDMRSDEAANRQALGELSLKWSTPHTKEGATGQIIRTQIKRLRAEFPEPKKLSAKKTAAEGVLERAYLSYSILSIDAVHPSITALRRHVHSEQEANGRYLTVSVVPPFKSKGRLATLDDASEALLGVCVGVNELLGGTAKSDELRKVFEQFEAQGHHSYCSVEKEGAEVAALSK